MIQKFSVNSYASFNGARVRIHRAEFNAKQKIWYYTVSYHGSTYNTFTVKENELT